jgi:hypothetical protein
LRLALRVRRVELAMTATLSHSPQSLITVPNFEAPDDFYEALIQAHAPLSETESHAYNARLVLTLANHIGDQNVLRQALELAIAH